jgi:PAP2 superfamily protein
VPVIPLMERSATPPSKTSSPGSPIRVRPRALPELALVVGLFLIYKLGRLVADGHVGRAFNNAKKVWDFERWAHLPSETAVQHAMMHSELVVRTANVYYAWVHFPVTVALLLWLYIYRPAHYVPIRRLMAVVTGLALAAHMLFPLAPPRMVAAFHMIDTATVYGPSVYGPPSTDTLSNQYAAMPSLHVGWALIVAIGFILSTRARWRWLWALYPVATFAVVVGTANHYWLDGLIGGVLVAVVAPLPGVLRRARAMPQPQPQPQPAKPVPALVPVALNRESVPAPRDSADAPVPAMLNIWVP